MTTYSFWMPYGMPATRRKSKPKPKGAPHIPVNEPMPIYEGMWFPTDEWFKANEHDEEVKIYGYQPNPSKVQSWDRQYGGSGSGLLNKWDFDALGEDKSSFVDPDGYWQWFDEVEFNSLGTLNGWGIWHTDTPKPVTPELPEVKPKEAKRKRDKCLKDSNGLRLRNKRGKLLKRFADNSRLDKRGEVRWDGYQILAAMFGNKAEVANEVCGSWAHNLEGRKEAVSRAVEWAVEYGEDIRTDKSTGWIRECVKNAVKEGSRDDGIDTWVRGSKGQECGNCHGTGNEVVEGNGLSDDWIVGPCETCEGTGKLTKRTYHRKLRANLVDPQQGVDWLGDDGSGETSESLTDLNDPRYRGFEQPIWGDYQQQQESWFPEGRPGADFAGYNYDALKLDQAGHWIDKEALEWAYLYLDGKSYQEIADMSGVPGKRQVSKATVIRRIKKLETELQRIPLGKAIAGKSDAVSDLRRAKWQARQDGKPRQHLGHDPLLSSDQVHKPKVRRVVGLVEVGTKADAKVVAPSFYSPVHGRQRLVTYDEAYVQGDYPQGSAHYHAG